MFEIVLEYQFENEEISNDEVINYVKNLFENNHTKMTKANKLSYDHMDGGYEFVLHCDYSTKDEVIEYLSHVVNIDSEEDKETVRNLISKI